MQKKFWLPLLCFSFLSLSISAQLNFYSQMGVSMHPSGYHMVTNCAFTQTLIWADPTWTTYSWSTGSTNDTIILNNAGPTTWSGKIYLTVTDAFGTPTLDSIYVNPDLESNQPGFFWSSGAFGTEVVCEGVSVSAFACDCAIVTPDTIRFSDGSTCVDYPGGGGPGAFCFHYPSTLVPGSFTIEYVRIRPSNGCRYESYPLSLVVVNHK
jgi:hypothetical protein